MTTSHLKPENTTPVVHFERKPIVEGPLNNFEEIRPRVLAEVSAQTMKDFSKAKSLELLVGEALYAERVRLKREHGNIFTKKRLKSDKALWNQIQDGLLQSSAQVDRTSLLKKITEHYAEEIGGHFDRRVYALSTQLVPFGFSWLLNAASVQRFLPWGLQESLESKMRILGEVSHLHKLSKKGTILLVPTHQSNIDSAMIGYINYQLSLPPFAYGAGLNLFSNPALNFFLSNLGAYTVDRKKTNVIYKQVLKNYSTKILSEGVHSIFFPGGGRSRSGAIETKLKLGLLGTALEAQIEGLKSGKPNPNIYVVPMTSSYHFVLEAASLIEDYLADAGKHRYIIMDDESWDPAKIIKFFWRFFSSQSVVTVRIGKPMDVFGNFVDEEGRSMGPNGTTIDPRNWLTSSGELVHHEQRDREYTRELGMKLSERFHRENTVITSHAVAFAYFEALRKQYPDLDLFKFLRLSLEQRSMQTEVFMKEADKLASRLIEMEKQGLLYLCQEFKTLDIRAWVRDGITQLGALHEAAVVKVSDKAIWTEDMNLLYYYRNRLSGYGLSLLATPGVETETLGKNDRKGFLE